MDAFLKFLKAAAKKAAAPVAYAATGAALQALGAPAWVADAAGSLLAFLF